MWRLNYLLCLQKHDKDNNSLTKVRVLETRSGSTYPRRIQHQLGTVQQPLDQPTVEFGHEVSPQDSTRASSSSNDRRPSLAVSPVLSATGVSGDQTTSVSDTATHSVDASTGNKSFTAEELETLRLASLNNKLGTSNELSLASKEFLSSSLVEDSTTNRAYKAAQLAFVEWCLHNQVNINSFTAEDLVNFLVYIQQTRKYQLSTLKLWRSATSRFHHAPSSLLDSTAIAAFFTNVAHQTAPRSIHKPTIDFSPTLVHLSTIPSRISTSFRVLQQKLAFLLGMVAFLRPSDLARIDLSSAILDPQHGTLFFNVVAPKERRQQVRIIKPFLVHPHPNLELCPVHCFKAVINHPVGIKRRPPDVLFVNSAHPSMPVKATTISSWLRSLLRLSTSEARVSVRSLGSSQALRHGISIDDIVTMGNWRNNETFHNYYRREHLATVNFTTSVLDLSDTLVPLEELNSAPLLDEDLTGGDTDESP